MKHFKACDILRPIQVKLDRSPKCPWIAQDKTRQVIIENLKIQWIHSIKSNKYHRYLFLLLCRLKFSDSLNFVNGIIFSSRGLILLTRHFQHFPFWPWRTHGHLVVYFALVNETFPLIFGYLFCFNEFIFLFVVCCCFFSLLFL